MCGWGSACTLPANPPLLPPSSPKLEKTKRPPGGAWYTENQFDTGFIEALSTACFTYVLRQKDATVPEIAAFVRARGFAKVELQEGDIESIVQTLVFDGRVDQARWPAAAPFFLILSQLFFFRPLSAARRSSSAPPGFSPCCSLPSKLKPCD